MGLVNTHPDSPICRVVAIGEALLDRYPTGDRLGGAPVNLAAHVRQLMGDRGVGVDAVTRLGIDPEGDRVLSQLAGMGLSIDHIQRDADHATGIVHVSLDTAGQPAYRITPDAAWDFLEDSPALHALATDASAVCFGVLAQRGPVSRATIRSFLARATRAARILDVNLRQRFYDADVLHASFALASFAKLSLDELSVVHDLLEGSANADMDARVARLIDRYRLRGLALTRGAAGTVLYMHGQRHESVPACYPPADNADAVGAGDAACAGLITGLLLGWPPQDVLALANHAGGFVASRPGAIPEIPTSLRQAVRTEGFRPGFDSSTDHRSKHQPPTEQLTSIPARHGGD